MRDVTPYDTDHCHRSHAMRPVVRRLALWLAYHGETIPDPAGPASLRRMREACSDHIIFLGDVRGAETLCGSDRAHSDGPADRVDIAWRRWIGSPSSRHSVALLDACYEALRRF